MREHESKRPKPYINEQIKLLVGDPGNLNSTKMRCRPASIMPHTKADEETSCVDRVAVQRTSGARVRSECRTIWLPPGEFGFGGGRYKHHQPHSRQTDRNGAHLGGAGQPDGAHHRGYPRALPTAAGVADYPVPLGTARLPHPPLPAFCAFRRGARGEHWLAARQITTGRRKMTMTLNGPYVSFARYTTER